MRKILIISLVTIGYILGVAKDANSQVVRSQTHRRYSAPRVYTSPTYRPYYNPHAYRYRYPRTYYNFGRSYYTGGYYPGSYYSFYGHLGPRFITYGPRCPAPCLPQPIVVPQSMVPPVKVVEEQPQKTETLKEGEVRKVGDVVIANVDGKIVVYQAEQTNGE